MSFLENIFGSSSQSNPASTAEVSGANAAGGPVKITETVLRDAHQSLLATRMRIGQMLPQLEALDKIGLKRLKRPVAGTRNRARTAAVVDQRVDRFLQHALFVADDDIRRAQLEKSL